MNVRGILARPAGSCREGSSLPLPIRQLFYNQEEESHAFRPIVDQHVNRQLLARQQIKSMGTMRHLSDLEGHHVWKNLMQRDVRSSLSSTVWSAHSRQSGLNSVLVWPPVFRTGTLQFQRSSDSYVTPSAIQARTVKMSCLSDNCTGSAGAKRPVCKIGETKPVVNPGHATRKARIRQLLLAVKSLDHRVDKLVARMTHRKTTDCAKNIARKTRVRHGACHEQDAEVIHSATPAEKLSLLNCSSSSYSCALGASRDSRQAELFKLGVFAAATGKNDTPSAGNKFTSDTWRNAAVNYSQPWPKRTRMVESGAVLNSCADSLSLLDRISRLKIKCISRETETGVFPACSLTIIKNFPKKQDESRLTENATAQRMTTSALILSAPSTDEDTDKVRCVRAAIAPSDLYFQFISGIEWQEAIAVGNFQLARFMRQVDVMAINATAFLSLGNMEVKHQRINLIRQRALYEKLLYKTLTLHGLAPDAVSLRAGTFAENLDYKYVEPRKTVAIESTWFKETRRGIMSDSTRAPAFVDAELTENFSTVPVGGYQTGATPILNRSEIDEPSCVPDAKVLSKTKHIDPALLTSSIMLLVGLRADSNDALQVTASWRSTTHVQFQSPSSVRPSPVDNSISTILKKLESDSTLDTRLKCSRSMTFEAMIFCVGDRVEAQFARGRTWYLGRVVRACDKILVCDVEYDDGDVDIALPPRFIRVPLLANRPGERIENDMSVVEEQRLTPTIKDLKAGGSYRPSGNFQVDSICGEFEHKEQGIHTHLFRSDSNTSQLEASTANDHRSRAAQVTNHPTEGRREDISPYSQQSAQPLQMPCVHDEDTLEASMERHRDNISAFRETSIATEGEQIWLGANVHAAKRNITLRSLEQELHHEIQGNEARIKSDHAFMNRVPLTEPFSKDAPCLSLFNSQSKGSNTQIPRKSLTKCSLESQGYDHIEFVGATSITEWLLLESKMDGITRNQANNIDSHSFASEDAICGLSKNSVMLDSDVCHYTSYEFVQPEHVCLFQADSFASRVNDNDRLTVSTSKHPTHSTSQPRECSMFEHSWRSNCAHESHSVLTGSDVHCLADYNHIETADHHYLNFTDVAQVFPVPSTGSWGSNSVSFFQRPPQAHRSYVSLPSKCAIASTTQITVSVVAYDCIEDAETPGGEYNCSACTRRQYILDHVSAQNSAVAYLDGYDIAEAALAPDDAIQSQSVATLAQSQHLPGRWHRLAFPPELTLSPKIFAETELVFELPRSLASSVSFDSYIDPDAATPLARHDVPSPLRACVEGASTPQIEARPPDPPVVSLSGDHISTNQSFVEALVRRLLFGLFEQSFTAVQRCGTSPWRSAVDPRIACFCDADNGESPGSLTDVSHEFSVPNDVPAAKLHLRPEQAPRNWSQAVAAYALWLASTGGGSESIGCGSRAAIDFTAEQPTSALLELFIDTEQQCDEQRLEFSVKRPESGEVPLTGGTREQAQIHRHAIFDALAEVVMENCHDLSNSVTAFTAWFKEPGEEISQNIMMCAAYSIANSSLVSGSCILELALGSGHVKRRQCDICVSFAKRLLSAQLKSTLEAWKKEMDLTGTPESLLLAMSS